MHKSTSFSKLKMNGKHVKTCSVEILYLDGDGGLIITVGGEGLGLLGGDGGVALDERGHHPAGRLDAEGEGRHVQQQQVRHGLVRVTHQNGRLENTR